jgi:hypothetical protein
MLAIEYTLFSVFNLDSVYYNKSDYIKTGRFITYSPLESNGCNTILDQAKEQEYCSYRPADLRRTFGRPAYFVIMNELYATQQHKIANNIITSKDISEELDSLIKTIEMSGVERFISIKELLLLRHICNNYEITAESKGLLAGIGNNNPFSKSNQPTTGCFIDMRPAGKSRILAELRDVKKSFDT